MTRQPGPRDERAVARERARIAAWVGGTLAAAGAALAAWAAAAVGLRWVMAVARGARFGLRLVTLTAYRRCPQCFRVLRREARVCRSCGAATRRPASR